jgi:integrase/recombinase XerD
MSARTPARVPCEAELHPIPQPLPADRHPAAVYLATLAPGSRRTMRDALNVVAGILTHGRCDLQTLDWSAIRYQHAQAVRTALAERYAPANANKHLAALRGVLREAWRLGLLPAEELHRATDLAPVKGETLPQGRALSRGELRALFAACGADTSPAGARDAALFSVLYGAGLRRSEAVLLDLSDFNDETGELRVRSGKRIRDRLVYATNGGRRALQTWLEHRGHAPGPLFLAVNKAGVIASTGRRLSAQSVYDALAKRAEEAGVARFSPHDLRRTFISDLLDLGADISTVQALAGHANVQTTARYDRRGEKAKRRAAEMLQVPLEATPREDQELPAR